MIDISTFHPQVHASNLIAHRKDQDIPTFSTLLTEFRVFRKELNIFITNYVGDDYFDFFQRLSELQYLLDSIIVKMESHANSYFGVPYLPFFSSILNYSTSESKLKEVTELNCISEVVESLDSLILSTTQEGSEAMKNENYLSGSMLKDFNKELEKSRWIFYMFSKY
ncbi:hypothetical protein [Algoriphagus sp.]|uniref:hypothetical protein n=1 Tax=Algoriphagus sp. TaxID=1872435 RepID=UPI00391A8195